jgi:predicted DNA-binding transcriptional regulator YafY
LRSATSDARHWRQWHAAPSSLTKVSTKIDATERLLNLVIALLGSSRGRSRHYIRQNVNGYARIATASAAEAKAGPAFERMFERDKELLREVGIPIITATTFDQDDQEQALYRINPAEYRVPEVRLDEPAIMMLAVAANLWAEAAFGEAAQSALRKVATRAGLGWTEDDATVQSRVRTLEPAFEPLWTALRQGNAVNFSYRSSGAESATERVIHPWGLGNKYGQWYLAGFDADKGAPRHFRLSRIVSEVRVKKDDAFERPHDFSIAAVLDTLGTGTPYTARVQVPHGAAHHLRSRAGTIVAAPDPTKPEHANETLSITYREPELMADDLAAMGATAMVLDPPELRSAVAARLRAASAAAEAVTAEAVDFGPPRPAPAARKKDTRDRLVRLLSMVPFLVANPGIELAEIAREFGISEKAVAADLDTLMVSGLPGYLHGDLMDVTTEAGQVFIRDAETLASPLRLTQEEACALLVGLEALRAIPGTSQEQSLAKAIDSLKGVAGEDAWLANAVALQLVSGSELETITELQAMVHDARAAAITYLVRSRDELTRRVIEPRRVFSIDSTWYVRAWCRNAEELRNFRVENIRALADAGAQSHPVADEAAGSAGIYTPGRDDREVELLADPTTARRLAPAYGATVHELAGSQLVGMRLLVGEPGTMAPLMARLAGRARVIAPEDVRSQTRSWLAEAAARYGNPGGAPGFDAVGESTPGTPSQGR